jgi:vacuolar-type H+-ATPase subunit I/STV1
VKELYVGNTTNFRQRKTCHKNACRCEKNRSYPLKVYQFIRSNGGWENWEMIEIEKYPCKDGDEARARERHWYEELNASLNTFCPLRTEEERIKYNIENCRRYNETHKEEHAEYSREYREKHQEHIQEYARLYREQHRAEAKEYAKQYHAQNKENNNEKQRLYRQKNKDALNAREKQRYAEKKLQKEKEKSATYTCQNSSVCISAITREASSAVSKMNDAISCETDTSAGEYVISGFHIASNICQLQCT